jgi:hypothetical protein
MPTSLAPCSCGLRAMNIIYETTKERGTTILIPSSMVDSMNPAAVTALALNSSHAIGTPLGDVAIAH